MADKDTLTGVFGGIAALVAAFGTWHKARKAKANKTKKEEIEKLRKQWEAEKTVPPEVAHALRRQDLDYLLRRQAAYVAISDAMVDLQEVTASPRIVLLAGVLKSGDVVTGIVLQENTINAKSKVSSDWTGLPLSPWYLAMLAGIPEGETFSLRTATIPDGETLKEVYKRDNVELAEVTVLARGKNAAPFDTVYLSVNRLDDEDLWSDHGNFLQRKVALNTISVRWHDLY